jgi:hypothetical protein
MSEPSPRLRIELLYFDGCPSYKKAWSDLLDVLAETALDAHVTVRPIRVDTLEKAEALQFAGSPTIKIEGRDLEGYTGPGLMACRVYQENRNRGWPSKTLLKQELEAAQVGPG